MSQTNYIILGGGCFWGMEELLSSFQGVTETVVGYTGGSLENPTYKDITTGVTGHAESVKITYEEESTNLKEIFHFFFRIHNPTTVNQQGNDRGTQYRSVIFVRTLDQAKLAKAVIDEVNASGKWSAPIVTTIEDEKIFYDAEEYHQKYLKKNPGGYNCHFIRD